MKLSEEMAVRLHRMMWSDMQRELGDKPSEEDRLTFKSEWIEKNFPGQFVLHRCFLCEYAQQMYIDKDSGICRNCPIVWPGDFCNGVIKSYATMPISEILALPARNEKVSAEAVAGSYYKYREDLLSKASGIPASSAIEDHVKAIQEKAVEEYFERKPGAKLATMDVDNAFKQYADEQKAHIFRALAKESGLDPTATVKAHINAIYSKGFDDGETEEFEHIMDKIQEMLNK